ncbi:MAG: hypothetical protein CMM25_08230 [Rhodospirillaceae bacterium]|nr:hypothetical protein [Rhodospirillaceae bacterium]|tara:strand:- start:372 stop:629 length:258 start_codon:yes stop_codon:yes gene_type:complete
MAESSSEPAAGAVDQDAEIRDLRREIGELRELLIGMKRSTDNMDSHIGFIMGAYDRYSNALEFVREIFLTIRTRLLPGSEVGALE